MTQFLNRSFSLVVAALVLATASLHAQYTELYNFNWHAEGANPNQPMLLAQGQDGNLYGTLETQLSGTGSVFAWAVPGGGLAEIFGFTGPDGNTPQSGLTLGLDGSFYGTTETGGTSNFGTVFKISSTGVLTTLYNFTNGADGAYPWAPPVQGPDGNIYGVTNNGTNQGRVYRITSSGVFSVIAAAPSETQAPLILGSDGNFYGTTPYGGTYNRGTVFQLTTQGKVKTIHSFNPSTEGDIPVGPVMQGSDGKLYGTTAWAGTGGVGTVYSMTTGGAGVKVLHNFQASEASNSYSGLVQGSDKYLYGVAQAGGGNGQGSLFKINTAGSSFSVLYNFAHALGDAPMSTPTLHTNGIIYGTTQNGGPQNAGYGTIWSYNAGLKPFASLVIVWSGNVGAKVEIIGQGFNTATGVKFGTTPAVFTVVSDTDMTALVPAGATTASVTVLEPGGNLVTPQVFKVLPQITSFAPNAGPVGTQVVITGMSLSQATAVAFGNTKAIFAVNSDTQITATVPAGAATSKIKITTKGGSVTSAKSFTVQ